MIELNHQTAKSNRAGDDSIGLDFEAQLSLRRLMPRLAEHWQHKGVSPELAHEFEVRLDQYWNRLFGLLFNLYGARYDFFYHLEQILLTAATSWAERPQELREIDRQRMYDPDWFASEQVVGGALYVDLFSENLGRQYALKSALAMREQPILNCRLLVQESEFARKLQ